MRNPRGGIREFVPGAAICIMRTSCKVRFVQMGYDGTVLVVPLVGPRSRVEIDPVARRVQVVLRGWLRSPIEMPLSEVVGFVSPLGKPSVQQGLLALEEVPCIPNFRNTGTGRVNLAIVFRSPVSLPKRRWGCSRQLGLRNDEVLVDAVLLCTKKSVEPAMALRAAGLTEYDNAIDALLTCRATTGDPAEVGRQAAEAARRATSRKRMTWFSYALVLLLLPARAHLVHGVAEDLMLGLALPSMGVLLYWRRSMRYRRKPSEPGPLAPPN